MLRAVLITLATLAVLGDAPRWIPLASPTQERLRGVSAVDDKIAWASGSKGTVVRTADGGTTWQALSGPWDPSLDFRDIEAIDANLVFVLSIGSGAQSRIYRTTDAGKTWSNVFTNPEPAAFYDAIAFWDARSGLALSDPVGGRFRILRTSDGGSTWTRLPAEGMPPALAREGAFAASGTCLIAGRHRSAWFVTGGAAQARVFRSSDGGATWQTSDSRLAAGTPSAGGFSLAFADDGLHGVAVGGDYRNESASGDNVALTDDGGATWSLAPARLRGFRSAVAFAAGSRTVLFAVGPAGTDFSTDRGASWTAIGDDGFHALSVAHRGGAVWAVGERGTIAKLSGLPR